MKKNKYSLIVEPSVFDILPEYQAGILYGLGLRNPEPTEEIVAFSREAERGVCTEFEDLKPQEHPHMASWRQAYAKFNVKPSKHLNSCEALLKRSLKGQPLPTYDTIATIYNATSIAYKLPMGGEDLNKLSGDLLLKVTNGSESFTCKSMGELVTETLPEGEIAWVDSGDNTVTCRRLNWRQGVKTLLDDKTEDAYFVLDALPPFGAGEIQKASSALIYELKRFFPEAQFFGQIVSLNGVTELKV